MEEEYWPALPPLWKSAYLSGATKGTRSRYESFLEQVSANQRGGLKRKDNLVWRLSARRANQHEEIIEADSTSLNESKVDTSGDDMKLDFPHLCPDGSPASSSPI